MSRAFKIIMWVIIIFAVIGITGIIWAKSVWDKISFSMPRIKAMNLNGLTLADLKNALLQDESKDVSTTLEMDVVNKNNFSIPFSNLKVKLFYQDRPIAETSNLLEGQQRIPANGTFTASDDVNITLSKAGTQMLIDKLVSGKINLDYKIIVKVFGIPLPKSLQTQTLEF